MNFFAVHKKYLYPAFVVVILLSSALLLLYHLGREPFQDYDEATYAQVTNESLAHENYLSLTYLGSPFWRKPPLLIWINDVDTKVFAPLTGSEFAMRLSSVSAAVLTILVVMLICFEAVGSGAALLAGGILATTTAFMEPGRQVRFDILVSLFITATFYAFLRTQPSAEKQKENGKEERKEKTGAWKKNRAVWYVAAGIFFGLAVLSKNVIAGFAIVAVGSYALASRNFRFFRDKFFWLGALAALVVMVPWHFYETIRFGEAFWDSYLGMEVLARVSNNIFGQGVGPSNTDYLTYFLNYAAPWAELFFFGLLALGLLWKKMPRLSRDVCLASLFTVLTIMGIMLNSQTKALSYLIPLYPFLAVFLALVGAEVWKLFEKYPEERRAVLAIVVVTFAVCAYATTQNVLHISPYYHWQDEYTFEEQYIGQMIKASGPNPLVYTYNDSDLGTILYYSALSSTPNRYIYLLSTSSEPTLGAMVITTTPQNTLASALPEFSFTPLYQGEDVSLFGVSPRTSNSFHK